jgi:peptidoglycan/LPS O-acetylase OafA/YrhL
MLALGIVMLLGSYEFRNENFRIVFMYSVQGLSIVAILNYVIFANDAVAIVTRRLLEANIAVYVGKISYVLYLWHLPVLFLLRDTYGKRFAVTFVAGLLSVALSVATYSFVEKPILQLRRSFGSHAT